MVLRRRLVLWFAVPLVLRAGVVSAMPQEAVFNTPPADRLAIVRGAPQSLRAVEQNGSVFVSMDELLASLGWTRCGARCAIAPGSAGGPRRWTLSPGSVAAVQNEDFANVRDLEALFGVKAGWDRFDNYVWVVGGDALPPPSREGPNIPIPSKNYGPFDAAGIPMKDHGAAGIQYNPLVVLEYSTVYFRNYLDTGEDKYRAAFFRMIDWLRGSAVPVAAAPQTAAWYYEFDWPPFARGPFLAGITQAYAGSAFVDSYILSGDEQYLEQARRAMAVLKLPTTKGGVFSTDRRGAHAFLEEYPSPQPSRVLGGCAETLLRLRRYLQYDADRELEDVYARTLATLIDILPLYDAPEARTSRYALSQEVGFRLVAAATPLGERHPVSTLRVRPPDDEPFELALGDPAAATHPGYHIVEAPASNWSLPDLEDGREIRSFAPAGAAESHAAFYLRLSGFLRSARAQVVEIDYRDVSRELVHVEIQSAGKGYVRLGSLENQNDGRWKTASFSITPETIGQSGFGLLAPGAYTTMHIGWLMQLATVSGNSRFSEYAQKWDGYLSGQE